MVAYVSVECGPHCNPERCDKELPILCGCYDCDEDVWNQTAGGFTCLDRILDLLSRDDRQTGRRYTEEKACALVSKSYWGICGPAWCEKGDWWSWNSLMLWFLIFFFLVVIHRNVTASRSIADATVVRKKNGTRGLVEDPPLAGLESCIYRRLMADATQKKLPVYKFRAKYVTNPLIVGCSQPRND